MIKKIDALAQENNHNNNKINQAIDQTFIEVMFYYVL
jgi:hypothetical protein